MSDISESPGRQTRQKASKDSPVPVPTEINGSTQKGPSTSKPKNNTKGDKKPPVPPKPKLGNKTPSSKGKSKKSVTPKSIDKKLAIAVKPMEISEKSDELDSIEIKSEPASGMLESLLQSDEDSGEIKSNSMDISIPDSIRKEAGKHWRLKEAILTSYHFGRATILAADFARSESESKTAAIITDPMHSWDSKKHHVKMHLANYQKWVRSATVCTKRISGKRKRAVFDNSRSTGKSRKLSSQNTAVSEYCDVLAGNTFSAFEKEQLNLENMRSV